jgi:hypothetical protein
MSNIYADSGKVPELATTGLAFFNQSQAQTWVVDKAPWEPIPAGIPQFETWAPKAVLHQRGSRQDEARLGRRSSHGLQCEHHSYTRPPARHLYVLGAQVESP